MAKETQRIELTGNLELALPDGTVVRIRPGPYGKGISVVPLLPRAPRAGGARPGGAKRGRKPRPSTVKLREKLARDVKADNVKAPRDYVKWLLQQDDDVGLATARQVVYRERRAALEAANGES